MSDNYLRLIPEDSEYVPDSSASAQAVSILQSVVPVTAKVGTTITEEVRFIDQGENFERVACPKCRTSLDEWWTMEMDRAWKDHFNDLSTITPCCGANVSLNDFEYEWPAGFARFVLEVRNPSLERWLEPAHMARLESILKCKPRQVLARY